MSPDLSRLAEMNISKDGLHPVHIIRAREEFTGAEKPEIVLAFDQSFSATGWAVMRFGHGPIQIMATGTFKAVSPLTGAMEDIERGEQVYDYVKDLLTTRTRGGVLSFTKIYFETPPKGGHIKNPEVSLMSALAVRLAVRDATNQVAEPVSPKTWKKMASGNANLKEKKVAHEAVRNWDCVEGFEQATNESQRDAVMVGLASQWKGA